MRADTPPADTPAAADTMPGKNSTPVRHTGTRTAEAGQHGEQSQSADPVEGATDGARRPKRWTWLIELFNTGDPELAYPEGMLSGPPELRFWVWADSLERSWYLTRRPRVYRFVVVGVAALLAAGVLVQPGNRTDTTTWWAGILAVSAGIVLVYCTFPYWAARRAFAARTRMMAVLRASSKLSDAAEQENPPLNKLFELNRRQLDAYLDASRRQQRTAFLTGQISMLIGLLVLVAGIVVSLSDSPASDKYVVAGLTGLGALLSAYLGSTFLRAARRADEQLNLYYAEPHMNGRMLVAERIARSLCQDNAHAEATAMITALLAWPVPGVTDGTRQATADTDHATSNQQVPP